MSERRSYCKWTAEQKLGIVLVSITSGKVEATCREHDISSTLYCRWRDQLLEDGLKALTGKAERDGSRDLKGRIAQLERALGKKTYDLEIAGQALRDWE